MSDKEVSIIPFGMFELNAAGVVIHYSPSAEERRRDAPSEVVVGRSFFDELLPAAEVEELKSRFHVFMADGASVERFTMSFPHNRESVKVQIVMAHLSEKTENGRERFALIRLMPDLYTSASGLVRA